MMHRLGMILCSLAMLGSLLSCARVGRVTPYELGVGLQDKGDFPGAIEHYKEVLAKHPEHLRARFNLAVIYHDQAGLYRDQKQYAEAKEKYAEAQEQYKLLLERYPNHARSLVNLADIAEAEGEHARAHVLLLRAIEAEPDRAYPYSYLGRYLQAQGQLQAAQEAYDRALAIEDDALTHFRLGTLRLEQGDRDAAKGHFLQAIELNPSEHRSLYQLALLSIEDNNLEAATRYLQRLTFLTPHDATVFLLLGKVSLQRQQFINAALALWEARDLQPALPELETLLLHTYEALLERQRLIVGQ